MTHPGLANEWLWLIIPGMIWIGFQAIFWGGTQQINQGGYSLSKLPIVGALFRYLTAQTQLLLLLKLLILGLFLMVIGAGLWGSQIAERNIATVLTWNLWWTGLIISIWLFGSSWCAICPWDLIANWLVRRKIWRNSTVETRLNFTVPAIFRNLWSALFMFTILTWLELGIGVTDDPYATASLSLMMVVLATLSLVIYKEKAFCRYFCPVGRTIGVYSQLSAVALRPIEPLICSSCQTLDCYHGNDSIAPCPTKLVMGKLKESTYCISCGNCTQSCPSNNINWQVRSPSVEAIQEARPHTDEAGFMIGLLGLTSFHGLTMLPVWRKIVSQLARAIGDSGQLITTFTLMMGIVLVITFLFYGLFVSLFKMLNRGFSLQQIFSGFAFITLPLAFSYHVAHNMNHLLRESGNLVEVFKNPLGTNTLPLSMMEKHQRATELLISPDVISIIQVGLLLFGFWLSIQVVKHRGKSIFNAQKWQLLSPIIFCTCVTIGNFWLLSQPMMMRM